MKIIQLKCPSCGASLEAEDNLEKFYCKYCGAKIVLAEQDKAVIGAKVFKDFLAYRERNAERRAEEKRQELEKEREENKRNDRFLACMLIGFAIFFLLAFLLTK